MTWHARTKLGTEVYRPPPGPGDRVRAEIPASTSGDVAGQRLAYRSRELGRLLLLLRRCDSYFYQRALDVITGHVVSQLGMFTRS